MGTRDDLLSLGFDKGIEAVQHLGQQLVNRTEPHRCLMCGNDSVTPITMAEDRATPLRHAACGGSLYLEQVAMHHCVREPIRYFNWRGEFLWEQSMPRISSRLPE